MNKLTAACPLLLLAAAACTPERNGGSDISLPSGYSSFTDIDESGWRYSDTLRFDVDADAEGELRVAVRHSVDYPYSNLWLEVTLPGTDSLHPERDTLHLELADPFGLWRGKGVGPTRQAEAVVRPHVSLDSGQTVMLRHIMRLDTLPAIEQAGIFVIH